MKINNLTRQSQQFPGDDSNIAQPNQTGDISFFGAVTFDNSFNWDALKKTATSTAYNQRAEQGLVSMKDVHRLTFGAVAGAGSSALTTSGVDQIFSAGWSTVANYLNSNSFDAGGAIAVEAGWYRITSGGYVSCSGGSLTRLRVQVRQTIGGVHSYLTTGLSDVSFAAGNCFAFPYHATQVVFVSDIATIRPSYIATVSAGTLTLVAGRFHIQSMIFV